MKGSRSEGATLAWPLLLGRPRARPGPGSERGEGKTAAGAESVGTSPSDELLVRRIAEGSTAAFEPLFDRYRDRVFQFVLWQVDGSRDLAEELTQEIFFQLLRSASTFRQRSSFRTWLYSLARNVCRHHRRKHRREVDALCREESGEAAPAGTAGSSNALERLTSAEQEARVRRAVAALPRAQRAVLVLRDWEELSYAEIARVLEVPLGTVRSRLHHARRALAAALAVTEEDRRGL